MKLTIRVFSISLLLIMAAACATTTEQLPEKYNLDSSLDEIDQIQTYNVWSWEQVDNQSVILEVDWKDYYLLVLRRPIGRMVSGLSIGISNTNSTTITSGVDRIVVKDTPFTEYYIIDKIYKLKGKEQAEEIKERLRKE